MTGYRRTEEEKKLIAFYARQVVAGEYESAAAAARACMREHERMRATLAAPPPPRALFGFELAIGIAARKLGRPPVVHRWTLAELHVVKCYARDLTDGKYRRLSDAVRACQSEMAGRRTPGSISERISRHAAELGRAPVLTYWTRDENRIADRFAKAVVDGQYPGCTAAADDCMRALKAAGMAERTREDVYSKLIRQTRPLGRKPKWTRWNSEEQAILEPYARRLMNGEYHSGDEAARACERSLVLAGFSSHSIFGVRLRVLSVARALGRECYAHRGFARHSK